MRETYRTTHSAGELALLLQIKIYSDNFFPTDKVIWEIEYSGEKADKEHRALLALSTNPLMQGEMISLRLKDGEGGGLQGSV